MTKVSKWENQTWIQAYYGESEKREKCGQQIGSGSIITEDFDKLSVTYEGSPSVRLLPFGGETSSNVHNDKSNDDNSKDGFMASVRTHKWRHKQVFCDWVH